MSTSLRLLHFNDGIFHVLSTERKTQTNIRTVQVYRVTPQKTSSGTISVSQFAYLLSSLTSKASPPSVPGTEAPEKPLLFFSGDVFSPSVESTITRGSHMVSVMNAFDLDVALTG